MSQRFAGGEKKCDPLHDPFFMALSFRRKDNSFETFEVKSNVKQMIKIENLSLEKLSQKSGVSQDIIRQVLSHDQIKNVAFGDLLSIANALHISVTYLFDIYGFSKRWNNSYFYN